jgi:hypothetical protein
LNDRAIDGESGTSERSPRWKASEQIVVDEREYRKFSFKLPTKDLADGIIRPGVQLSVPGWAVIERECRDSAENVVWPVSIGQIRR